MRFTIKSEQETLCQTCRNGTVAVTSTGRIMVNCSYFERLMPPISQCTDYTSTIGMSMHDMERRAWIVEVKKGKVIGFKSPDKERHSSSLDYED